MLFTATRIRTLVTTIAIYLFGLVVFVYFQQSILKQQQTAEIDLDLRKAVAATRAEVADKLQHDFSGETILSFNQDHDLAHKLNEIVSSKNIDYVYTVIKLGQNIYFTSSSETEQESHNDDEYKFVYMSPYEDASDILINVFNTGKPVFDQYNDQWGHFRTFFYPVFNGNKISYVIGADISMKKVDELLSKSKIMSFLFGICLSLIALPLIWFFIRSIQKERKAEHIILYIDPESGLNNVNKLKEDISCEENLKLALIEFDNYSKILNTVGPSKATYIVKQFINRIHLFIESEDFDVQLYRINDDKFALLTNINLEKINIEEKLSTLFQHLVKTGYGTSSNRNLHLSVHMGAAANEEFLFVLANMALEEAKRRNKSIVFYNDTLKLPQIYLDNIHQTNIFHKAIEENRVKAFFQPIVDAKTAEIAKFECFARVVNNKGKVIQEPNVFMPIAYRNRLCHKVTRLMLDQSLEAIKQHGFPIAINIAVQDLFDYSTMNYICEQLENSHLAQQVEFEILEYEDIRDYTTASMHINRLKKLGSKVGIDDLGKRYSNFDRLFSLPLDYVKIDGGIMPYIEDDIDAFNIAQNIVALAKNRNLSIVAEYCLNSRIYDAAIKLEVDYLQGFYIGLPDSKIPRIIKNHGNAKAELIQLYPIDTRTG